MKEDSKVSKRAIHSAVVTALQPPTIDDAIFQHSVLCQTFLPYKDLGKEVTIWAQKQGKAELNIQCLQMRNHATNEYEYKGLPYGTRGRLILTFLNDMAIKNQSPEINVESTLTGFIKAMGLHKNGQSLSDIRDQLTRINMSVIGIAYKQSENRTLHAHLQIVREFDVSFMKNANQIYLWNNVIRLSDDYFESLMEHAIPLDQRAVVALSHNPLAMDMYAWMCQRLTRIDKTKPSFVAWKNLKEQFGTNYKEMKKFREKFNIALTQVMAQYKDAKIEVNKGGMILKNSPCPIPPKTLAFYK